MKKLVKGKSKNTFEFEHSYFMEEKKRIRKENKKKGKI